ncbi:MAG TPA: hypothetical protein VE088_08035 [Gaiellaceae bacterium]|jgi:hypothetical protein|nr:hypothetical protein [Gaiellaceae bacterium]
MQIGKPRRIHRVEPVKDPVPRRRREQEPSPSRSVPAKEPAVPGR